MVETLTLFCPSRGRPEAARALLDSFSGTIATKEARLVFLVDNDDPTRDQYPSPPNGSPVEGEPTGDPTGPLNRAALASTSSIVGFIGDDSRCETNGWDRMVIENLREPGFCWGRDGTTVGGQPWPSTCFVSKDIVQKLGYIVPPTLRRGFFDEFWVVLAVESGSFRPIDALFTHDNSKGDPSKPNFDPKEQVPPEIIVSDEAAYKEWSVKQKAADVKKVKTVLDLAHFFPVAS